jgi:hypothetical protein
LAASPTHAFWHATHHHAVLPDGRVFAIKVDVVVIDRDDGSRVALVPWWPHWSHVRGVLFASPN